MCVLMDCQYKIRKAHLRLVRRKCLISGPARCRLRMRTNGLPLGGHKLGTAHRMRATKALSRFHSATLNKKLLVIGVAQSPSLIPTPRTRAHQLSM